MQQAKLIFDNKKSRSKNVTFSNENLKQQDKVGPLPVEIGNYTNPTSNA